MDFDIVETTEYPKQTAEEDPFRDFNWLVASGIACDFKYNFNMAD